PRTPLPTLFPHATPFRSPRAVFAPNPPPAGAAPPAPVPPSAPDGIAVLETSYGEYGFPEFLANALEERVYPIIEGVRQELGEAVDRKSTRLNSSHGKISY